ncbi:ABC transporter A family member 2-like isoform X1 [Spinacia oleracea]|uniref:ABC transporter A family member 2-like isoform X1 n=1 Tax=Spinacia oleracea TaxID=3562 RepID=A0A9R0K4Z7_SPIOL|nr:ABC transporter A family member 2-like isoform X1 [Spinacia oleracea]
MELQKGIPLLFQQLKALFRKNALLSWRHKWATTLQLFSSLVFIFLMFCIQKSIEAQFKNTSLFDNVIDPTPLVSPSIPPCEDKFFVKLPCYDFVYSGASNANINRIVSRIRANNPGRPIPPSKVRSFATEAEVDVWLLRNPMYCPGALHFVEQNRSIISYGVQTNSTAVQRRGKYEDPTFKFQIPLQIAAEREIARFLMGDPNFSWTVGLKEFAHPSADPFSTIGTIGPTFFLAVAMFGFVFQLSSLVMEKELKLREAMSMMGLYDTAYWMSWLAWEGLLVVVSSIFIVLFGMMFQFDFFTHNSFAILFLVFFLFQLNMTSFAFALSAFISQSSSATNIGFYNFIVGLVTQIVTAFGFPYSDRFSQAYRIIWSFYPPNLLAKALQMLSDATMTPQDPGMSWSGRTKCSPNDDECILTMNDVFIWLLGTFVLWFVLALYFDNIIPNPYGVRKSAFYFLYPGYWTGKGGSKAQEGGICTCFRSSLQVEQITTDDEDVLKEENNVKQQANEGVVSSNVAVQIRGLAKVYPGSTTLGCCKCNRTPPYHALRGLWVNLAKDQLFCLLGPNGAGKTTAINCLTGISPVTGGDALIHGNSIRSSVGMSNIRRIIGVCPQFDILWNELTGQEHLNLFANIKGLPMAAVSTVVKDSLEEVRLTNAAKMRTSSYSGGMKRRLSVAIALIGDPKLIILDEPTTGMDPISRRHVWDIIENAKRGRAIILTTHSMEEADILSDRIGIMAKGRLRCIGTSIRLKSRFGTGFIANVSFVENLNGTPVQGEGDSTDMKNQEAVKRFFKDRLGVAPKEENKSFLTFVIPHKKEELLTTFFEELQEREGEFCIADIQLGLTSLEEVFLNIARQAEMESAAAEGKLVTLNLTTSETSVEIPVGAEYVGIPGTESVENPRGVMVQVYWEQDDSGALCISGHSREVPIPLNVQIPTQAPFTNSRRGVLGRTEKIHGVVINTDQIPDTIFHR